MRHLVKPSLFVCLLIAVKGVMVLPSHASTAPTREVVVEKTQNQEKVHWKKLWDKARDTARRGSLQQAAVVYSQLLSIKPNIEEANWEYCRVLMEMSEWQQAGVLLESLIEIDPHRIEYLYSAGQVALERQNYLQAAQYYGQVYEGDPLGELSTQALEGLIAGFEGLGKKKNAFSLMEQLYQRKGENPELLLKMASFSHETGMVDKAKHYYEKLVTNYSVDEATLFQVALLFDGHEESEKSIYYYERYLQMQPEYIPFRKKAADYYLVRKKRSLALPHLLSIYKSGEENGELLQLLGRIYLEDKKRPDKALFFFEKYQEIYPADKDNKKVIARIQTVLANDFLSIVENDGAWRLWRDLANITPNRKEIYLAMADLLEQLNKKEDLLEVLEIVHKHDQRDNEVTLRIVTLYKEREQYEKALQYFSRLSGRQKEKAGNLLLKADLYFHMGDQIQALQHYLAYLKVSPMDQSVRISCLKIAGKLGLIEDLEFAYKAEKNSYSNERSFSQLDRLYLQGLRASGLVKKATLHYDKYLQDIDPSSSAGIEIRMQKMEGLQMQGLVYEAEQLARTILAENKEIEKVLEKLTELAIEDEQLRWANSWFYLFLEKNRTIAPTGEFWKWPENIFLLKIKILDAEGEYEDAVNLLDRYIDEGEKENTLGLERNRGPLLSLIRLHYKYGEFELCGQILERYSEQYPYNIELEVIANQLKKVSVETGLPALASREQNRKVSLVSLLERATLEYEYEALEGAMKSVEQVLDEIPYSVRAKLLQSKIYAAMGQYSEALQILGEMYSDFPDEYYIELLALKIEYRRGNFKQIVQEFPAPPSQDATLADYGDTQLPEKYHFPKQLILARSLWADKQWEAALKIYNSLLDVPVETLLLEKMEAEEVNFSIPPLKQSLWNMITFTTPEQPDPVATIMRPSFVGKNIGKPIAQISANLYKKYRWQKLIERELFVREAMKRRNYHEVEKEYRASLKRGGAKDTLFDLAEVYGRMGLYGKEAELYEQIQKEGPEYPELHELVRLNRLKRTPRISANYQYTTEEGRGGYIDMQRKSSGIEGWVMPNLKQELNLSYYTNQYESSDGQEKVRSDRWYASYTSNFEDKVDLNMSFGLEDVRDDGEYTILYNIEFLGRIDDLVQGQLSFNQDIVDDTVEAVEERIYFQSLEGGLTFDLAPRWFCGFDYGHREYNDDNRQDMFRLWTSYNLYGESNLLRLKYAYENFQNNQANLGQSLGLRRDFERYDPPYWSPSQYWHHRMMAHFKHTFSHGNNDEKMLSHYTVDYSLGYESGKSVTQEAAFHIFLEMNRHFLLKGNFTYGSASDYDNVDLGLSFIYRW